MFLVSIILAWHEDTVTFDIPYRVIATKIPEFYLNTFV